MESILIAAAIVGGTGLLIGLFLGFAAEKFHVPVNEKEEQITAVLPGNNCGGCGYAGCVALAKAITNGEAGTNACPVGGEAVAQKISDIMGVEAASLVKEVAFVSCNGTCEYVKENCEYVGIEDCQAATAVPGGTSKACPYGCSGFGSCVKACPFDAIHVINGIACVDKEACKACKKCIEACPKNLIKLVPYTAEYLVKCSSRDKGKDVKAVCSTGCIGCGICAKNCEFDAITVENNLASIDPYKCKQCGVCAAKCPVKIITVG